MTLGFVVAFGGVLLFGVVASVVIAAMTRTQAPSGERDANLLRSEIDQRLARAEVATRRAEAEIAEVRAILAR